MLSPYTVLDLTDDRGELASMVLGDLRADVIKVEPPEGSSSRRTGPFLIDAPDPERSLRYFAFNRNKRSVTLDLSVAEGRQALIVLAAKADFIIESAQPGEMDQLGLGFDRLRQANPRIVYVAITPYGQDGPHAKLAASDLTLAAMSGQMSLQGDPSRPPVRISVPQVWLHASVEAVVGALTAHARMLATEEAQFVDVSAQTAMVWTMLHARVAHAIQGFDFNRGGSTLQLGAITVPIVYECADGYVVVIPSGATMTKMVHWLVADGIVPEEWIEGEDWPIYERNLFQQGALRYQLDEVADALQRYLKIRSKSELLELGLREGVTLAPVSTIGDLVRFRHLKERGYWLTAPLPNGAQVPVPGLLARLSETPTSVRRWPPRLGQHNQEILGDGLVPSGKETAVASSQEKGQGIAVPDSLPPDSLPFKGVKVLDLTWVWVGPTTTKYLADHGATVVRVETLGRPDITRIIGPYKDGEPGPNRSHAFNDFNTSKLGLTLNLKTPEGVEIAKRLIAWADVYIESFTPRYGGRPRNRLRYCSGVKPLDHHGQHLSHGSERASGSLRRIRVPRWCRSGLLRGNGLARPAPGRTMDSLYRCRSSSDSGSDSDGCTGPSPPDRPGPGYRRRANGDVPAIPGARDHRLQLERSFGDAEGQPVGYSRSSWGVSLCRKGPVVCHRCRK